MTDAEIILKTMASVSGMLLSSVSVIQFIHLYNKKNSDGFSALSLEVVIFSFSLLIPYFIFYKLYILLLFNCLQMLLTTGVLALIFYYRMKNKNRLEIIDDINSHSVSNIDRDIILEIIE